MQSGLQGYQNKLVNTGQSSTATWLHVAGYSAHNNHDKQAYLSDPLSPTPAEAYFKTFWNPWFNKWSYARQLHCPHI